MTDPFVLEDTPRALKDYRVQVKVKNNYLLTMMEKAGFWNVRQLCLAHDLSMNVVGMVCNLRLSVVNSRGGIRPIYLRLSKIFNCLPKDLVPPQHYEFPLPKNSGNVEISFQEISTLLPGFMETVPQLPDYRLEQEDFLHVLSGLLDELNPRERIVITRRFGLEGEAPATLKEIGDDLGVGKERTAQIERKALRRLARPDRKQKLLEVAPIDLTNTRPITRSNTSAELAEAMRRSPQTTAWKDAITKMRQRNQRER